MLEEMKQLTDISRCIDRNYTQKENSTDISRSTDTPHPHTDTFQSHQHNEDLPLKKLHQINVSGIDKPRYPLKQ